MLWEVAAVAKRFVGRFVATAEGAVFLRRIFFAYTPFDGDSALVNGDYPARYRDIT